MIPAHFFDPLILYMYKLVTYMCYIDTYYAYVYINIFISFKNQLARKDLNIEKYF